jgi:hypothetical protein
MFRFLKKHRKAEQGSIELIVIGLLAALIIVLAIPVLQDIGVKTHDNLQEVSQKL